MYKPNPLSVFHHASKFLLLYFPRYPASQGHVQIVRKSFRIPPGMTDSLTSDTYGFRFHYRSQNNQLIQMSYEEEFEYKM